MSAHAEIGGAKLVNHGWVSAKEDDAHAIKRVLDMGTQSLGPDYYEFLLGALIKLVETRSIPCVNLPEPIAPSHARALQAPACHSLQECLAELKYGRTAEDQKFLDECIRRFNTPMNIEDGVEEAIKPLVKDGVLFGTYDYMHGWRDAIKAVLDVLKQPQQPRAWE